MPVMQKLVLVFGGVFVLVAVGAVILVLTGPKIEAQPDVTPEPVVTVAPQPVVVVEPPVVEEAPEEVVAPEPPTVEDEPEPVEAPTVTVEEPPAPVEEVDVWGTLTDSDRFIPQGYVAGQTMTMTWEDMPEEQRAQAEDGGISFRRMYMCQIKEQDAQMPTVVYAVLEADDAASAADIRDVVDNKAGGASGYAGSFVSGRYLVYAMGMGEDSQVGETLLSNLKNAVGYED